MDYEINKFCAGMTVKEFLFKKLGFSAAAVKRVKYRETGILLNGESVTVRKILSAGDILSLALEDREEDENEYTVPVDIPVGIVYEDEYIVVVNKPPMMPSHPSLGHKDDTVANALAFRYRNKPYVFRPVNRLDRDTSGLMLIAKDKVSAGKLYRSMMKKEIKKAYLAVLEGVMDPLAGRIETYICRKDDSIVERRVCEESEPGAKISVTEYETLDSSGGCSLVRAVPVTGRTHQLRVHFSHRGCPIAGDTMYGRESPLISRQALHASELSFPHPESGETMSFSAPLPDDITYLLDSVGIDSN